MGGWRLTASKLRVFCLCEYREGAGPLRCRSKPLCHSGARLPDDQTKPDAGGGHQNSEGPQGRHPQPGFPTPAQRPRRHFEGKSQDVPAELRAPSVSASRRQPDVAATLVTLEAQKQDQIKRAKVANFNFTDLFLGFFFFIFPSIYCLFFFFWVDVACFWRDLCRMSKILRGISK